MKRILLAVTMLVLVLPAMRQAEASTEVSLDFFYDNLGSDGSWVEVADYGYCWQPSVAVSNSNWRPYADGYWAYTDVGWTWVSYEDFGWATYHYGRWTRLRDRGWFWVPGREWGPAWVSWRTGGDYVGWAPLPPHSGDEEYDDRSINGQVDVEFDIGPEYYNFVDVRYIGEPVLRERIFEASVNITYISQTVNVTNISYTNSVVYNYGPDYNRLNRYSTRPIRRMTIERDVNADLSAAVKSKSLTRVQGDRLIIAAPPRLQKPPKPIAPRVVKEKIAKPTFEHGWNGVSDPKAQAELKRKMKSEDPKNVPPPTIKPRENAETAQSPGGALPAASAPATATSPAVSSVPVATAAPAASASPALALDKDKRKDKRSESAAPLPTAVASVSPASGPAATPPERHPKERGEKPAATPPSSAAPITGPAPTLSKPVDDRPRISIPPGPPRPKSTPPNAPPTNNVPPKPRDTVPAPSNREAPPPDIPSKRPTPPPRGVLPKRETPPEPPQKQAPAVLPRERIAPPPGPGPNVPAKPEGPREKRDPDQKKPEQTPSPKS
jgi:hypothetical protein